MSEKFLAIVPVLLVALEGCSPDDATTRSGTRNIAYWGCNRQTGSVGQAGGITASAACEARCGLEGQVPLQTAGQPFGLGFTASLEPNAASRREALWSQDYVDLLCSQAAQWTALTGLQEITVGTYYPPINGRSDAAFEQARLWLDQLSRAGIRLIVHLVNYDDRVVPGPEINYFGLNTKDHPPRSYLEYVRRFDHHPVIRGYSLSNDCNYFATTHPEWFYAEGAATERITHEGAVENILRMNEAVARELKRVGTRRPVIALWAGLPARGQVDRCPSIDIWGINSYAIPEIVDGTFFREAKNIFQGRPFFLHETGVDSFDAAQSGEDEAIQAKEDVAVYSATLKYAPSNFLYLLFMSANDVAWKNHSESYVHAVLQRSNGTPQRDDDVADAFNGRFWGLWRRDGSAKAVVRQLAAAVRTRLAQTTASGPEDNAEKDTPPAGSETALRPKNH